jgi:HPt (histidine-containing phosphotransfer) domain-containing protein
VLRELERTQLGGKPGFAEKIVRQFLKSAPPLLQELENGAATCDNYLLYHVSHRLKSSSGMVGAKVLSWRCERLETQARRGIVADAAAALVAEIAADYRIAAAYLSAHVSSMIEQRGETPRARSLGASRVAKRPTRSRNHKNIQDAAEQSDPGGDHDIHLDA